MLGVFARVAFLRFIILFAYLLIAGSIMYAIEKPDTDIPATAKSRHSSLERLWRNMSARFNMNREEFEEFTVLAQGTLSECEKQEWTALGAVAFVGVMCSTIGYGTLTPQTPPGRALCIVISIFGIPLTLLTLNAIGVLIAHACRKLVIFVDEKLLKRDISNHVEIKSFILTLLLLVLLFVIGVGTTMSLSDWSIFEGLYFWFVTFSTIGFGDYTLKEGLRKALGKHPEFINFVSVLTLVFLVVGLSVLASVLNAAVGLAQKVLPNYSNCVRCGCRSCLKRFNGDDDVGHGEAN